MRIIHFIFLFTFFISNYAQENSLSVLELSEFLAIVKKNHPIVKQANLIINEGEATLLKTRGMFDPKIEINYDTKEFKESTYYDNLNATFKIPTWYGIELKAGFEENQGTFLNPEATVPENGLYAAGVSVSVAQGLLINKRMASLKKAKNYYKQTQQEQLINVNTILYNAAIQYFNWLRYYDENNIHKDFLKNAKERFDGIKKSFEVGDKAAIDTLEASIQVTNRVLNLEKSRINLLKARLALSNYLWLPNNIPVVLEDTIVPDITTKSKIDTILKIALFNSSSFQVSEHPTIKSLELKLENLDIDIKLKRNQLLPKIDFQYNFLTQDAGNLSTLNQNNYKAGIQFSMPIFLRKERGNLKLANIKRSEVKFETAFSKLNLQNKVDGLTAALDSYIYQSELINKIIGDYEKLYNGENRKLFLGESSLFLVNSRENKLINHKLKAIALQNTFFETKASLFKLLVINY